MAPSRPRRFESTVGVGAGVGAGVAAGVGQGVGVGKFCTIAPRSDWAGDVARVTPSPTRSIVQESAAT
jgi:hypothetical protein